VFSQHVFGKRSRVRSWFHIAKLSFDNPPSWSTRTRSRLPFFHALSSCLWFGFIASLYYSMPFFSTLQSLLASLTDNSPPSYRSTSRPLSPIRDYVPSSIHIPVPTAAPSPPLISRPIVSYAQFSGSLTTSTHQHSQPTQTHNRTPSQQQEFEREYERGGEFGYGYGYGKEYAQPQPQRASMHVQASPRSQQQPLSLPTSGGFSGSGLAQAMRRGAAGVRGSFVGRGTGGADRMPASKRILTKGRVDAISWARWDTLNGRYVFLGPFALGW